MAVHFLQNELQRWDETEGDALVLTFFSDERPLRGAAGLADWRLCGRLSRLIKHRRISGRRGESVMLPPGRRLTFNRVFLFGLGSSQRFDEETYRQHVRWIRDVLRRAGASNYAIQAPGRAREFIGARRSLELWMEEADKDDVEAEVAIIDSRAGHKEMSEVLRYRSRHKKA